MAQRLNMPLDLPTDLAESWPEQAELKFVGVEKLVDADSLFPEDEKVWAAKGKLAVVAQTELFAGTPDVKRISRRSIPVDEPSIELCRETMQRLAADVRTALENWRRNEAPETLPRA